MSPITPHVQVLSNTPEARRREGIDLSPIRISFEDTPSVSDAELRIPQELLVSSPQRTMSTMLQFEAIEALRKATGNE